MSIDDPRIERILAAASRAPSVHNTQPWSVRVRGTTLDVLADDSRRLTHADPAGREMLISCGAFLANLRVAARRESFRPVLTLLPDDADPALVARVDLVPGVLPDADELDLAVAIERRATSRVPFEDQPLDADVVDDLDKAATSEGARLVTLAPQAPERTVLLDLVREAEEAAGKDHSGRVEQARWVTNDPDRPDGIPVAALGPRSEDALAPVRHFGGDSTSDRAAFEHRSTLAVLTTPGDSVRDWLAAGQALERVLLTATTYFVHASFATTVLENPTTRAALTAALDAGAPQMVLRLGYSATSPRTPRRPADDVVR
ncbi:Acg family FMN-binding oxidoreductase [Oerskovia sp. NPDC060338]|uniref:Acg family FMN-binding oxidoreductase n=1 Tax=Oerskovia sp. NPDC060338 TaxID=3347100 RepID=UPI00364BA0B7